MSVEKLCEDVLGVIEAARGKVFRAVNVAIVRSYWEIGRLIVEEEQHGADRAAYGKQVVELLSIRLQSIYGKGYNKTNLWYMRQFYRLFDNPHALRGELSWTHYRLLLKIEQKDARNFYLEEAAAGNWNTRTLERQIKGSIRVGFFGCQAGIYLV